MKYDVKEKLEWTVIFLFEFGHKYGLTMKQAFNYLSRFKGIDLLIGIMIMCIRSRLHRWWMILRNIAVDKEESWYEIISWYE